MIINADDFGYSENVNKAVAECFKQGLINRATIMVNMPCCNEAVTIAKENGFIDRVGLHVNLTEGRALTEECRKSSLCNDDGYFKGCFHLKLKDRFFISKDAKRAMYIEIEAQMKRYTDLGFTLMHADSHNYVHTYPCVAKSFNTLLKKYNFKSVRISRNIPKGDFSYLFDIYKLIYNTKMRRFKVGKNTIDTTRYFGSAEDFKKLDPTTEDINNTELMTHPIIKEGVLYDDTLPNPHPFEKIENENICLADLSKKKLLITFIQVHIGGAMTSLVNFLNALDLNKYEVDVLFYEDNIGGRHGIKEGINILPPAKMHKKYGIKNILTKAFYPPYVTAKLREIYNLKIKKNRKKAIHIMAKQGCKYSVRLDKRYDVAVSYEFSWCMYYTARYVNADRRILWHHLDYEAAGFDFKLDESTFDRFDNMVFVSGETMNKFIKAHPKYKNNSIYMPNLMSAEYVRSKGEEAVSPMFGEAELKLITVARIDFDHKGYDRGVEIMRRFKEEGIIRKVRWIIIGKGKHLEKLQELISRYGLEKYIKCLGSKTNPIPYLKECDIMFLPSRFEGKPMAVTEGLIMGLVPLVAEYTSANEQIENGVDGIVTDNNTEGLYEGLKRVVLNPGIIKEIKVNIQNRDYGNTDKISIFDKLIEG